MKNLNNTIIVIDEQSGSGAEAIGRELAAMLGVACYGVEEQLAEAARLSGIEKRLMKKYAEKNVRAAYDLAADGYDRLRLPPSGDFLAAKSKAVSALSQAGNCVFAGGHASLVFADRKNVIRIYVHAEPEARVRELPEYAGMNTAQAVGELVRADKKRSAYYQKQNPEWGAASFYHLVFDTTQLNVQDAAMRIHDFFHGTNTAGHPQERSA